MFYLRLLIIILVNHSLNLIMCRAVVPSAFHAKPSIVAISENEITMETQSYVKIISGKESSHNFNKRSGCQGAAKMGLVTFSSTPTAIIHYYV